MKAMLLASVLAGCATGPSPTPPAAIGNTAAPAAQDSPGDVEAHLPADAVLVWYEAKAYADELSLLSFGRCAKEASRFASGFTAVRPDGGQSQYLLGTADRDLVVGCLRERLQALDPATQVTEQGDQTKLAGQYRTRWIAWHERFLAVGDEPFASPVTPPADERVATFRAMRRSEVAVWTTLPLVRAILGVEAKELLIQLDTLDMPQEWVRQVSGTITVRLGSSADAAAAKAALASGQIATLTDPKLVAALRGLPVEVVGATLRARLTDLTFSLRDLLDQVGPVLSGGSRAPGP